VTFPADTELFARVLAKTIEYLDCPAVVGHETPFLDHLARDFTALGHSVSREPNLCVIDMGSVDTASPVFIAHADRHGAVLLDDGTALYAAQTENNLKLADSEENQTDFPDTLAKRYVGETVYAYDRATGGRLAYGRVRETQLDDQNRLILTIADLPDLPAGTPIALARALSQGKPGVVSGQLDNPVSLAALRIAAEFGLKGRIIFTAEEETGHSAHHFLNWAQSGGQAPTQNLIACDTSPFDDGAAALAGAVILRRRDAFASFNSQAISTLEAAAGLAGAPMIFKDSFIARENDARARRERPLKSMGATELGRITADSQGAYTGATLQLPTHNYHSNEETTSVKALTAYVRTLLAI